MSPPAYGAEAASRVARRDPDAVAGLADLGSVCPRRSSLRSIRTAESVKLDALPARFQRAPAGSCAADTPFGVFGKPIIVVDAHRARRARALSIAASPYSSKTGFRFDVDLLDAHAAGFDLRIIEHVVDDREQRVAGALHVAGTRAPSFSGVSRNNRRTQYFCLMGVRIVADHARRSLGRSWSCAAGARASCLVGETNHQRDRRRRARAAWCG